MKVKISEATNLQLDWLVASAQHLNTIQIKGGVTYTPSYPKIGGAPYSPTTDWAQGGPIIEREKISVGNPNGDPGWIGSKATPAKPKRNGTPQWTNKWECGPTPLIAAMRCYVASKLGDEVEVPDELGGTV